METVRSSISKKMSELEEVIGKYRALLDLSDDFLNIEADRIIILSGKYICMTDESNPGLCVDLLNAGFDTLSRGRKSLSSNGKMTVSFHMGLGDGSELFVNVSRESLRECRRALVRITDERTITVCGDLPDNYELIGFLDDDEDVREYQREIEESPAQ